MKVNNKPMFIDWLNRFKKTLKSKSFKSVNPYLSYMSIIETHLRLGPDEIYFGGTIPEIHLLEEKLKKKKSFKELEKHYQSNLLSALHLYESYIGLMNNHEGKSK